MSTMKIGTSLKYFNKKCEKFKEVSKKRLLTEKIEDENALSELLSNSVPTTVEIDQSHFHNNQQDSDSLLGRSEHMSTTQTNKHALSAGSHYVVDNFDIFQKVRDMSEDRQNRDIHWVNHNKIVNRVSANHLPNDGPICDLDDVDNSKLIPSLSDNVNQRRDYITLVERILVTSIPYLSFCTDIVSQHIPHKHSKESAMKSDKVIMCFHCFFHYTLSNWVKKQDMCGFGACCGLIVSVCKNFG